MMKRSANPFQKCTSLDTFEELYEAVVANSAIRFHVWALQQFFYHGSSLTAVFAFDISITRRTLVLKSYTDQDILVVEPSSHVVALAWLS
jgi:hypothetical protein